MIIACQVLLYKKDEYQILASEAGRESTVILRCAQGDNRKTAGADDADEQIHPAMTQIGVRIQKFICIIGPLRSRHRFARLVWTIRKLCHRSHPPRLYTCSWATNQRVITTKMFRHIKAMIGSSNGA